MRFGLFNNDAAASAGPSRSASTSSGTLNPTDGSTSTSPISSSRSVVDRVETIFKDEETYQTKQYPTYEEVPGCMQLFDEFMMCYALMPQLRSFYRHAEFRDCTWKWQDFKYCLSLKSESSEVRKELWIKRRTEWWANRRLGGSSEDVWDLRTEKLENFPPLYTDEAAAESAQTM